TFPRYCPATKVSSPIVVIELTTWASGLSNDTRKTSSPEGDHLPRNTSGLAGSAALSLPPKERLPLKSPATRMFPCVSVPTPAIHLSVDGSPPPPRAQ